MPVEKDKPLPEFLDDLGLAASEEGGKGDCLFYALAAGVTDALPGDKPTTADDLRKQFAVALVEKASDAEVTRIEREAREVDPGLLAQNPAKILFDFVKDRLAVRNPGAYDDVLKSRVWRRIGLASSLALSSEDQTMSCPNIWGTTEWLSVLLETPALQGFGIATLDDEEYQGNCSLSFESAGDDPPSRGWILLLNKDNRHFQVLRDSERGSAHFSTEDFKESPIVHRALERCEYVVPDDLRE